MAKVRIVRGKAAISSRNFKHYLTKYLPYVSFIISTLALLKAYNVII